MRCALGQATAGVLIGHTPNADARRIRRHGVISERDTTVTAHDEFTVGIPRQMHPTSTGDHDDDRDTPMHDTPIPQIAECGADHRRAAAG
ncbi:hypothetical protein A5788_04570 [Gordonia sp. 852002-50816_SCH5313054-c]|nr:hypothetical protein A5786_10775 [Gordonia sp. 852002-50816_SCH5313054-a]OBC21136.1 hypothetical protein A5788_04570 [Gordonia sp. 852002-50816_SCH5313054-c]